MTAAPHGKGQPGIRSDAHDLLYIARRRDLDDRARSAFDDGVVDATKTIVVTMARINDRSY